LYAASYDNILTADDRLRKNVGMVFKNQTFSENYFSKMYSLQLRVTGYR
jgi:hypothetical protein